MHWDSLSRWRAPSNRSVAAGLRSRPPAGAADLGEHGAWLKEFSPPRSSGTRSSAYCFPYRRNMHRSRKNGLFEQDQDLSRGITSARGSQRDDEWQIAQAHGFSMYCSGYSTLRNRFQTSAKHRHWPETGGMLAGPTLPGVLGHQCQSRAVLVVEQNPAGRIPSGVPAVSRRASVSYICS